MGWLIQGLTSHLVWEIMGILGGGAFLGYLRKRVPEHASAIAWGLLGATCIAVLIFTITGRSLMSTKPPEEITPENVEANVKIWADNLAMSLERQNPPDSQFFSYIGRVHQGDPVKIFRIKEKPGYLQFQGTLGLSSEHQVALSKLSAREASKLINELNLELARLRMSVDLAVRLDAKREPTDISIIVVKAAPIPNLNEALFADNFDEVARAINEMRAALTVGLETDTIRRPGLP